MPPNLSSQEPPQAPEGVAAPPPADHEIFEPCPVCGAQPVSVQLYMYVLSFIIFTSHAEYAAALCRACATRQGMKELTKSALLGWWGIPWGLFTFKAIWVNTRSLMAWSRLAPSSAALLGMAGILVPVFALMTIASLGQAPVEDLSDPYMVRQETYGHMVRGEELAAAGNMPAALEQYEMACKLSPGKPVPQFLMARALWSLDRTSEALPHAARAEALEPDYLAAAALHGLLLLKVGRPEGAEIRARRLRDRSPPDAGDAFWLGAFYLAHDEPDVALRMVDAGLAMEPDDGQLLLHRIDALLRLDRMEEAGRSLESLDEEIRATPYARVLAIDREMAARPLEAVEGLIEIWQAAGGLREDLMLRLRSRAEGGGHLAEVQDRIRAWLHAEETSPDAWLSARPWFEDEQWIAELDRYLGARMEPAPALLRLSKMDPVVESGRILELAARARVPAHPLASQLDSVYFHALQRREGAAAAREALERHLEEQPEHFLCGLSLAMLLLETDPEAAGPPIQKLRLLGAGMPESPQWAVIAEMVRLNRELVLGRSEEALGGLRQLDPASIKPLYDESSLDLLVAEAAFFAGDAETLDQRLRRIGRAGDPDHEAPALLLRWSYQIATGAAPTYQLDVDDLLSRHGEALRTSLSASAQAILLAEGLVDREWSRKAAGKGREATFAFVEAVRAMAQGRKGEEALAAVAGAEPRSSYAARLARAIGERRASL